MKRPRESGSADGQSLSGHTLTPPSPPCTCEAVNSLSFWKPLSCAHKQKPYAGGRQGRIPLPRPRWQHRLPHSKNTLMNYRPKDKTLWLKFFKERHGNESLLQSRGKRVRYVKKLLLTVTAKLLRAYSHPKTSYKQRKPISASHKEPNKSIFIWGGRLQNTMGKDSNVTRTKGTMSQEQEHSKTTPLTTYRTIRMALGHHTNCNCLSVRFLQSWEERNKKDGYIMDS